MTDFKRRTLFLSTGRQIKLYGNSLAIGASLEIGEGSAPSIFSFSAQQEQQNVRAENPNDSLEEKVVKDKPAKKQTAAVVNPHRLTEPDLMEIADYNIRLWLDLKDNIRKYGVGNPKIFNCE